MLHIVCHFGTTRADVYRRIFQILLYGGKIGDKRDGSKPTYTYPAELRYAVRSRFPDPDAGRRDAEFALSANYMVTWEELAAVKWPVPPKSCAMCSTKRYKPY